MRIKRILIVCVTAMLVLGAIAGCGASADPNAITIRYYVGGYGKDWLKQATEKYTEETGVRFNLIDDSTIKANIGIYLERNVPDIIMTESFEWQESVYMGKIEPLDSVFETEVTGGNGAKIKIKDYLVDELKQWPYMQRLRGQGSEHPWVLPWTALSVGIVYNDTMMKTIPNGLTPDTNDTWQAPPATVFELMQYCEDVESQGKVAISWGGKCMHWWMMPLYVWWAQRQGVKEAADDLTEQGSWYDFWDFAMHADGALDYREGYRVWEQTGLHEAIDVLGELFFNADGTYRNSPQKPDSRDTQDVERLFVNGDAAMTFCGSWLEKEMEDFIKDGVTMKMMPMPTVDDAVVNPETGKSYTINNAQAGDVMLIPAKADEAKKQKSKEFLAWLCNSEQLSEFTKETGTMRPFTYDPEQLAPDYTYSEFSKSVFDNYLRSDYNLFEMSLNNSDTFKYMRKHIFNGDAKTALLNLKDGLTGKEIMVTGNSVKAPNWKPVMEMIQKDWATQLEQFKIS